MGATAAYSVHDDGLFELDGDAVSSAALLGDDWDFVYANRENGCDAEGGPVVCSFTTDAVDASIFTTGGSKDEQALSSWRHTAGAVPAKDDLLHAFAAQYDTGTLYFGADRYATNGDAQIGFWFFHDEVSLNADGTFSGVHTAHAANGPGTEDDTNGDLLILSNFSNGGTLPTIRVFEWYGVDDVRQVGTPASSLCGSPTSANDAACAITSDGVGPDVSPWPFDAKQGTDDQFGNGAFYEGGVDLASLGFGGDCFASYLAETRSSTSITATLKDFVLGTLGECGVEVTTQASETVVSIGTDGSVDVTDSASVLGTGSVGQPNPTGTVAFHLCGPSESEISSCEATADNLVSTEALSGASNPGTATSDVTAVTSAGYYCWTASYSGDDNYDAAVDDGTNECFQVTPVTPAISTQATAGPVDPGDPISDTATLSGTALDPDGSEADGTITFSLYGPFAADATPDCTGTPVFTDTAAVDSGDGDYTSDPYSDTVTGLYYWVASYDGDPPNTLGVSGSCGDANETSEVAQTNPTLYTVQTWVPNDSATIDSDGGGNLDGTASFSLYASADCEAGGDAAVYTESVAVSGAATVTVGTQNDGAADGGVTGYVASTTGDHSWSVSYDSNLAGQADIAASCVEVTNLTIDNDITVP